MFRTSRLFFSLALALLLQGERSEAAQGPCQWDKRLAETLGAAADPLERARRAREFFQQEAQAAARALEDMLQQVQNDPLEVQRKVLADSWERQNTWVDGQVFCLIKEGVVSERDAQELRGLFVLMSSPFREAYQGLYGRGIARDKRAPLDLSARKYLEALEIAVGRGPEDFKFRDGNKLDVLVDGRPYREAILETIRGAQRYVHLSSLHMAQDRFGQVLAAELAAKKMGYGSGEEFQAYLQKNGWNLARDSEKIRHDFVRRRLDRQVSLQEISPQAAEAVLKDRGEVEQAYRELTKGFEVRLLLDFHTTRLAPIKNADTGSKGVLPLLRGFGAEVSYIPSFIFMVNHAKFVASESQAVVAGGNFIDKVVNWDWGNIEFHDVAIKVRGRLVNDINGLFITLYNKFLDVNRFGRAIDVPGQAAGQYRNARFQEVDPRRKSEDGAPYYFPPGNEESPEGDSVGKLVTTINGESNKSVNARTLKKVVQDAQGFIYLENPFFTDGGVAQWLIRKAHSWNLRKEKEANGEIAAGEMVQATCDWDRMQRRSGKRGIVVLLPAHHDQPLVKVANDSLITPLLNAGVDVCKWEGSLYNQHKQEAEAGASGELYDLMRQDLEKGYKPDAMLHSKVWSVDGKLGYIGSANLTVRSQKGDLELGVMSADSRVVADMDKRIMRMNLWNSKPTKARRVNYLWWPVRNFFTRIFPVM